MPSRDHESLLELFRTHPQLVVHLLLQCAAELGELEALGALRADAYDTIEIASADLNQLSPTEYRADLVLVLRRAGSPVLVVIIEVQLSPDPPKRYSWPVYLTTARARHKCPTILVVVTPNEAIAHWASKPIELGAGSVVRPIVIGPRQVPHVQSLEQARAFPELAVLAAIAHANAPDALEQGAFGLAATRGLTHDEAKVYSDWILASVGPAVRSALEEAMKQNWEPRSEFFRNLIAEGLNQGRSEGLAEGEAKGLAGALLTVLESRAVQIDANQREQILTCCELPRLRQWLQNALNATSIDQVFADARI